MGEPVGQAWGRAGHLGPLRALGGAVVDDRDLWPTLGQVEGAHEDLRLVDCSPRGLLRPERALDRRSLAAAERLHGAGRGLRAARRTSTATSWAR